MIKIGFGDIDIFDNRKSRSIWSVKGKVYFKGTAFIGHGSKINVGANGSVTFGKNFTITAESSIVCNKCINFGNDNLLSWDVLIMDDDFHNILDSQQNIINNPNDITIGNWVWIGCRSLILKGSNIPSNSIIAAGSLVSKKLTEENSIYGGNPIAIIKKEIHWEK